MNIEKLKEIKNYEEYLDYYVSNVGLKNKTNRNIRILNSYRCGTSILAISQDEKVGKNRIYQILNSMLKIYINFCIKRQSHYSF